MSSTIETIKKLTKRIATLEKNKCADNTLPEYISVSEYARRRKCMRATVYSKIVSGDIVKESNGKINWDKYKKVYIISYKK